MKLFVVKYCLTSGIYQSEVDSKNPKDGDTVREIVDGKLGENKVAMVMTGTRHFKH